MRPALRNLLLLGGLTLTQRAIAILRRLGTSANTYIFGVGQVQGLTAGNYLDSVGTALATVDGLVGLDLDAMGSVGPELVPNGTFDAQGTWVTGTGWGISGGVAVHTAGTQANLYNSALVLTIGRTYKIVFDIVALAGTVTIFCGFGTSLVFSTTGTSKECTLVCAGDGILYIRSNGVSGAVTIDNISAREVTGIHATQPTAGSRPTLRRGIVNRALYSEVAGTGWNSTLGAVVTSNTTTAPDGAVTADTITFGTGDYRYQTFDTGAPILGTTYTFSRWLSSVSGKATISLRISNNSNGADSVPKSITLTTTLQRVSVTYTFTGAGNVIQYGLDNRSGSGGDGIAGDVICWGAQLETGSVASPYIPTTTAAASATTGAYWLDTATGTKSLTATFPAGYESCTVIDAAKTGQVTLAGQNLVGTVPVSVQLGAGLVVNGRFDTDITSWVDSSTAGGAIAWNAAGSMNLVYTTANAVGSQAFTTVVGKTYAVTASKGATTLSINVGVTAVGATLFAGAQDAIDVAASFVATATTTYVSAAKTAAGTGTVDNISVKQVISDISGKIILKTAPTAAELVTLQQYATKLAGL